MMNSEGVCMSKAFQKTLKIIPLVLATLTLPIAGFATTYGLLHIVNNQSHGFIYVFIMLILLAVPFWMMQLMWHIAHIVDPHEKEAHLRDFLKDADQMARPARGNTDR